MQPHYRPPPFLRQQKPAVLQIVHIETLGKHRRSSRISKNVKPGFQIRISIGIIRPEPHPRKMHPRSLIKRSSQRSVERSLRFEAIFQRLRFHVDAAPFTPRPDGFAPDDESQLYALREGLVNMCSHADYFSPMHPTVRVFDNRISFQNPGKIVVDMEHLRDRYQSAPRNPSLLKLFRYTKISDNAGYGMDKIYSWERLTGEKVEIVTDVMYSEVTFWRPKIGTSSRRKEKDSESSTAPKTAPNGGLKMAHQFWTWSGKS